MLVEREASSTISIRPLQLLHLLTMLLAESAPSWNQVEDVLPMVVIMVRSTGLQHVLRLMHGRVAAPARELLDGAPQRCDEEGRGGGSRRRPSSARPTLTPGDDFVVDDVRKGDGVHIESQRVHEDLLLASRVGCPQEDYPLKLFIYGHGCSITIS
ncbi:uncharacterized protein LOC119340003 [Triticum dicoccoides]|uniref:uncharacterized protein LOC119340003 n=1 Tax=Triticum dicoccoides TaxID=85692 RepID=UPI0018918759|nr:uncharacterized protein LOC119340003 [Triticum dicoccoides]